MKKLIFLLLVVFVLSGCKTMLDGTYEVRDATPEDMAVVNASNQEYRDKDAAAQKKRDMELAEESAAIGVGLVKVIDDGGGGWVKQITFSDGTVSVSGSDATVTVAGVSPGSGSVTTVQEEDAAGGGSGADIVVIDFQEAFAVTETPDTEVNISLDVTPDSGSATLVVEQDSVQVKYNTTDFQEGATGLLLGAAPTITGDLALGAAPASTGAAVGDLLMSNATGIYFEADAAGTDIAAIVVDSAELITIGGSGASGVTITPATTITGAVVASTSVDITGAAGLILENDETITNSADGTVQFDGIIDLASEGITNSGAIADDGAITVISSGGTVTVESVVFTGGAVSSATTIGASGDITTTEDLVIGDAKYIGSTTDKLAVQIEADGDIVLTDDITVGGGNINTGDIALTVGDATTDSITLTVDSTGDGEVVLPNDSVGDAEIDWVGLTASSILASPGITLTADSTLTDASPLFTLQDSDDAAGEGRIAAISSGGDNDIIFYLATEISTVTTDFIELDGVTETIDLLKPVVTSSTSNLSAGNVTLGAVLGTVDIGGATALEIPNGTSNPASTTGSIALDTNGTDADFTGPVLAISTSGATMGYIPTMTDMPAAGEDNYIMKYDAGSNLFVWEADADSGSPLYNTIGDPDGAGSITFQDEEDNVWVTEETDGDFFHISATGNFGDISIAKITQNTGNATDGALLELSTADAEDNVDQLLIMNGADDYTTFRQIEAGTFTIDVTSDGTASVDIVDALTAGSVASDAGVSGTTLTGTGKISTTVTTEQLRLNYDATNYATWTVDATGATTVTTVDNDGALAHLTFSPNGTIILTPATDVVGALTAASVASDAGVSGTTITGTAKISTTATTEQLRLSYDADNYATWTIDAEGALDIVTVDTDAAEADINFTPDGNVGIKTANPTVDLDVTGSVLVSADVEALTVTLTDTNADPAATGEMKYDTTVTGLSGGALAWYDDDEIRYIVDLETLPVNDGEVVSYNATDDIFEMSAAGAGDVLADASVPFTGELTITAAAPAMKFLDSDSADGTATLSFQATGANEIVASLQTDVAGTPTTFIELDGITATVDVIKDLAIGANPADAGTGIRMSNNTVIEFEDSENTGEVTALQVDSAELISIGDANASGLTLVPATTVTGTLTGSAMVTASVGITTTDGGLILSNSAALDQSGEGLVELTEAGDSLQFNFGGTDLGIVWSDGVLNLRNAEDSDAIVEIEGKDAGEKGVLRVLSDGDDKYITAYHDDTDSWIAASSGDVIIAPDGDTDDYVHISTATNVTSISVVGSTGTLGTAAAEWDALYLNDSGVIYGENDQANTITSSGTAWTFNQAIAAVDATFSGTTTVATLTMAGAASPQMSLNDSDAAGAAAADEESAKIFSNMTTTTEDAEVSDLWFTNMQAGSATTVMLFDGSANSVEVENLINAEAGITVSNGTTGGGFLDLYEDEDDGTDKIRFIAPALAADVTLTFPTTDGNPNEILKTDGSGGLSWTTAGTATAWDDITDPDNNARKTITFDNAAEATTLSTAYDAAGSFFKIDNTDAALANNTYLLDLDYSVDDNEANADYIRAQDAGGVVFSLQQDGDIATTGDIVTTSNVITLGDGSAGDPVLTFNSGNNGTIKWEEDGQDWEISDSVEIAGQVEAATYGSDGTVSDAELLYINSLSSNAQTQITTNAALVDTDDEIIAIINASPGTYIDIAAGGTGVGTLALNGVLYGNGTTDIQATAIGADGEILVAGADPFVPVWASGTGTGIPVRQGTPTLTTPVIGAATGSSLDVSGDVAGATVTIDNGGTITFTDGASDTIAHTNDTGIAMVSGSGTVTIESVVFTAGAMTAVDSIGISGAITGGNGDIITNATVDDEWELTTDDKEGIIFDLDTGTANEVAILSGTGKGVTEINTTLQFVTTGDIMGGINVSKKAGAYTIGTDDAHENFGTLWVNTNVADLTLPATVIGASGCLVQEEAVTGIMQLEPATSSFLIYEGVEMSDGAPLASAGAATDKICWVATDATHYTITAATGTWAE